MSKSVSIYQFANQVGVAPQRIYGLNREGKIPAELMVQAVDGKPMLKLDEALVWWEERSNAPRESRSAYVAPQADPKQILEMLVGWFEQANKKVLARDLKKVLAQMDQPEENQ